MAETYSSIPWGKITDIPFDAEKDLRYFKNLQSGCTKSDILLKKHTLSDVKRTVNVTLLCEMLDADSDLVELYERLGLEVDDTKKLSDIMERYGLDDSSCIDDLSMAAEPTA